VQVDEIHGTSGKKKSYVVPAKNKKIFFSREKNFQKNIFEITGEISGHRPGARIVLTIVSSSIRIQPYPQKQNRL